MLTKACTPPHSSSLEVPAGASCPENKMESDAEVESEADEETVSTISSFLSDENMLVRDDEEQTIRFSPSVARYLDP